MLAGRPPFTGKSTMALMYSHFHEEPEDIGVLRPDCPPQLRDAIMRMLRKDPAERWPSLEVAVAAMGARPLPHDDPTRSQLIQLARTSSTHRIVAQVQTPRSPIPLTRLREATNPPQAVARPRRPVLLTAAAVAFLGAGYLLARLVTPGESAVAPTPAAADSSGIAGAVRESTTVVQAPEPAARAPDVNGTGTGTANGRPDGGTGVASSSRIPAGAASDGQGRTGTAPAANERLVASDPPAIRAESTVSPGVGAVAADSALLPNVPTTRPQSPVISGAASPTINTPPPSTRTVAPEAEVSATILAYARALADADLAAARRLYPGMPADQRQGLEALWNEGGSMVPRWTVSEINVDGNVATARVTGTNVVRTRRSPDSEVPVSLRARLERRGTEWRLLALVN
jgi:hypothetical protein